jgi:hypothetical protein
MLATGLPVCPSITCRPRRYFNLHICSFCRSRFVVSALSSTLATSLHPIEERTTLREQDESNPDTVCRFNQRCSRQDCPFAHQSPAAPEGSALSSTLATSLDPIEERTTLRAILGTSLESGVDSGMRGGQQNGRGGRAMGMQGNPMMQMTPENQMQLMSHGAELHPSHGLGFD